MRKIQFPEFVALVQTMLDIQAPVKVRHYVRQIPGFANSCAIQKTKYAPNAKGYYHYIQVSNLNCIYNPEARGFFEVLAHELVHCYVDENHPKAKPHGRTFQRTAAALRRSLRALDMHIAPLHISEVDL